jgi:hypothetical protein
MEDFLLSCALRSNPDLKIAVQSGCCRELAQGKNIPDWKKFLFAPSFGCEVLALYMTGKESRVRQLREA